MKILIFSDLHVHNYSEFDENGSRLKRCLVALNTIFATAEAHAVNLIVDCGDLLDRKNLIDFAVYSELMQSLRLRLRTRNPCPLYLLAGNHNIASVHGYTNLDLLHDLATVITQPQAVHFGAVQLLFMPYYKTVTEWRAMLPIGHYDPANTILFAHQEIQGALTGTHRYVAKDTTIGLPAHDIQGFKRAFFGHYHLRQHFCDGRVMYVGAALQQDFGEEGNPQGFLIYDTDTDVVTPYSLEHLKSFRTITDPTAVDDNFCRLISNTVDDRTADMPNVRVEPIKQTDLSSKLLGFDPNNLSMTIEAYMKQRLPAEHHPLVWNAISEIYKEGT